MSRARCLACGEERSESPVPRISRAAGQSQLVPMKPMLPSLIFRRKKKPVREEAERVRQDGKHFQREEQERLERKKGVWDTHCSDSS